MPESPLDPETQDTPERRNLYRILHVQPEAPVEVIRASYRTLMSALRAHPDLGGDTARAAQINAAYAVLRDPLQRAAYDRSLRGRDAPCSPRPGASKPSAKSAPASDTTSAMPMTRACPFCGHATPPMVAPDTRCLACSAPLAPAPAPSRVPGELLGRRRGARVALDADATLQRRDDTRVLPAVLRDVSVTGVSLACQPALRAGTVIRITTARFDALARVVDCRATGPAHLVRAELLTLLLLPTPRSADRPQRAAG